MASDRSEYMKEWYQKNKEQCNEKRRKKKREKLKLSQEIITAITSKNKKHGYWWEEE